LRSVQALSHQKLPKSISNPKKSDGIVDKKGQIKAVIPQAALHLGTEVPRQQGAF